MTEENESFLDAFKDVMDKQVKIDAALEKRSVEELLEMLALERNKYTRANDKVIEILVDVLIERGEYPAQTVPGNRNTVRQMVSGYGAYWHRWRDLLECPHCKVDLRNHKTGPPFKREIGVYDRSRDRTSHFTCPDCKGMISR